MVPTFRRPDGGRAPVPAALPPTADVRADNNTFGIAWGVSVPAGDTRDFISRMSFRGSTVQFPNGAITGKRWHFINAVPIYAGWFKYFNGDKRSSRFYAGMNAGTAWIERRTEISLYALTDTNRHFAVAPEVGWQLPWDSFLGYVGARYHYAFKAGDTRAQQWFEFKIGFGLD